MIGTIVLAGRTIQIADIILARGQVIITTEPYPGPIPAIDETRLTIFGEDGHGIMQSERFSLSAIGAGESLVLAYAARIVAVGDDSTIQKADEQ